MRLRLRMALLGLAALVTAVSATPRVQMLTGEWYDLSEQGISNTSSGSGFPFSLRPSAQRIDRDHPSLGDVPLQEISQIIWREAPRLVVTSGRDTEVVGLGESLGESLPANWADMSSDLDWKRAQAPEIFHEWTHLPGAQWVWDRAQWPTGNERNRVLIRQRFDVPAQAQALNATLRIEVDDRLQAVRLNGTDLPLPPEVRRGGTWQVAEAIIPGNNVLALIVMDSPRQTPTGAMAINGAGVAFRLEAELIPQAPDSGGDCALQLVNGDHLSGKLEQIDDTGVVLDTPFGITRVDRDWIREVHLEQRNAPGGVMRGANAASQPSWPLVYEMLDELPEWAPGVLLDDGTHLSGRILSANSQGVQVKPRYNDTAVVPLNRIRKICLNAPQVDNYIHYPNQPNAARICRIETVHGDRMTGVLELIGDVIEINPPESDPIRVPVDQMRRCVFPLSGRLWAWDHLGNALGNRAMGAVLWGARETPSDEEPYNSNLISQINNMAEHYGFNVDWKGDVSFATGDVDPERNPLLVVVDEREQFPMTVAERGDGLQRLVNHLTGHGAVILMPSGTAFYHAREWDGIEWNLRPIRQQIPELLGLQYLPLGQISQQGRAFEVPSNRGETLRFVKVTDDPRWAILPDVVEHPVLNDIRFRPVQRASNSQGEAFEPIYQLVNDRGENYGVAMAAVELNEGNVAGANVYHIAPTLALADDQAGEPLMHRLMPAIMVDVFNPVDAR